MKRLIKFAGRLYRDEKGAEGAEKLLIIAAVVLPLLGFLIYMRDWIKEWMTGEAKTVQGDAEQFQNSGLN